MKLNQPIVDNMIYRDFIQASFGNYFEIFFIYIIINLSCNNSSGFGGPEKRCRIRVGKVLCPLNLELSMSY